MGAVRNREYTPEPEGWRWGPQGPFIQQVKGVTENLACWPAVLSLHGGGWSSSDWPSYDHVQSRRTWPPILVFPETLSPG